MSIPFGNERRIRNAALIALAFGVGCLAAAMGWLIWLLWLAG